MTADEQVTRDIEAGWVAALQSFGQATGVGPFVITHDPVDPLPWLNFAVPMRTIAREDYDVAMPLLREHFVKINRTLRFEFFADTNAALAKFLKADGLKLQAKLPVMVCTKHTRLDNDATVLRLTPSSSNGRLLGHLACMDSCAPPAAEIATEDRIEKLRDELAKPNTRTIVFLDGINVVGTASLLIGGRVAELIRVVTLPSHQKHGIAKALSNRLVNEFLAEGGSAVWLSAATDVARKVYEKVGFRHLGDQLNYIAE